MNIWKSNNESYKSNKQINYEGSAKAIKSIFLQLTQITQRVKELEGYVYIHQTITSLSYHSFYSLYSVFQIL